MCVQDVDANITGDGRTPLLPPFPFPQHVPGGIPPQRAALVTYFKETSLSILDSSCVED